MLSRVAAWLELELEQHRRAARGLPRSRGRRARDVTTSGALRASHASLCLAALASQDLVPERCLQGPKVWCQDWATAVECEREQYCRGLWADLLLWDQPAEEDEARPPGKKCRFCTKMMEQLKAMIGDDPDEESINNALRSVCKAMGRVMGRMCKALVKKYKDQLLEALQNNEDATEFCTNIRMCKGSAEPPALWN
ncbi:antimicrobial peptide NK-lysin-like isoform X3 [Carettochelys insculpta]|uniref:antimicrobial peptide NK-lysin-like isoform X3 n=1 Tax=Carettochelys insculpta TaxID=44489 RepID=UPI003EB89B44